MSAETPANEDVERLILGAILSSESPFLGFAGPLSQDDFYLEKHRRVFHACRDLFEAGQTVDRVTVSNTLTKQGKLKSVGGLSYLIGLEDGMPTLADPETYVAILREKSMLRRIMAVSEDAIQRCRANEDPKAVVDSVSSAFLEMGSIRPKTTLVSPVEIMSNCEGGVNGFLSRTSEGGINTPWTPLNNLLGGGYREGQLITLAARPGSGKSAKIVNQAIHSSRNGVTTAVYSLEMGASELIYRMLSGDSGISSARMRYGNLDTESRGRLNEAAFRLAELEDKLLISEDTSCSLSTIASDLHKRELSGNPIGLVILDYLQLMGSSVRYENRTQEISAYSRGLKLLAKQFKIPIIMLSQLSRAGEKEGREPILADCRDSGSVEQDSDVVIFLHTRKQDWEQRYRAVKLIVAKQRAGPLGHIVMQFDSALCQFGVMADKKDIDSEAAA